MANFYNIIGFAQFLATVLSLKSPLFLKVCYIFQIFLTYSSFIQKWNFYLDFFKEGDWVTSHRLFNSMGFFQIGNF